MRSQIFFYWISYNEFGYELIISASYKTDIPAFYGQWFMNRLRAGYCKMVNPYNRRVIRVPLGQSEVDGIVFWTKNVGPFLAHLKEVHETGFPFVLQHTINGYPRVLEQAVIDESSAVRDFVKVADRYGPRVCVWRYDTIIHSSVTPRDFHIKTFSRLASDLEGSTDEVVISFAQLYRKTLKNMNRAAKENDFTWDDPDESWKIDLVTEMESIATQHKMQLTLCSQPMFISPGCAEARCIDANRLADIAGNEITAVVKGNRDECACHKSRDIGDYDTCPHGCVYCYAVKNQELAKKRYKMHDPLDETLFPLI